MAHDWSSVPSVLPVGDMLPATSAKLRMRVFDTVFVMIGGTEAFAAWAGANDENRGKFYQMYSRGAARSTNIELTAGVGVEDIISQLDAGEHARVINAVAEPAKDEE